jgi:hypothetical protein
MVRTSMEPTAENCPQRSAFIDSVLGELRYASLTPEQWAQIDRAETVLGDLLKE